MCNYARSYSPGKHTFYPYGLPIEPLSSYAAIKTANKELYQSKLLDDEMGLNLYYFEARYFDPQTGRFIGMDPKMQMASGYQGMGGNPAMFVDPDGKMFWMIPIAIAALQGAAIATTTYVASSIIAGNSLNFKDWSKSAAMGALSGMASYGIGELFGEIGNIGHELGRASLHGLSNGTISAASGGDFKSGFASGAFSSLASSYTPQSWGESDRFVTSSLTGGISSAMSGGNFLQGAAAGGIGFLTNQLMHERPDADGELTLEEANRWYRYGKGKPLYVDAEKLDLEWVSDNGWSNGQKGVQTLFDSKFGRVYGNITLNRVSSTKATILPDQYNFEQHGSYFSSPIRNLANTIGRNVATQFGTIRGRSFYIHFKGVTTINTYHPIVTGRPYVNY